jgi:hypothetical protein
LHSAADLKLEDIMRRWIVLALWVTSLVVVSEATSAFMRAQAPSQAPPPDARVVSGADIGFRVESMNRTGEAVGRLVIRVNGQWVPARFAGEVRPAH